MIGRFNPQSLAKGDESCRKNNSNIEMEDKSSCEIKIESAILKIDSILGLSANRVQEVIRLYVPTRACIHIKWRLYKTRHVQTACPRFTNRIRYYLIIPVNRAYRSSAETVVALNNRHFQN